jgi:hypothetical protein
MLAFEKFLVWISNLTQDFYRFPQPLQLNAPIIPRVNHGRFLPNLSDSSLILPIRLRNWYIHKMTHRKVNWTPYVRACVRSLHMKTFQHDVYNTELISAHQQAAIWDVACYRNAWVYLPGASRFYVKSSGISDLHGTAENNPDKFRGLLYKNKSLALAALQLSVHNHCYSSYQSLSFCFFFFFYLLYIF